MRPNFEMEFFCMEFRAPFVLHLVGPTPMEEQSTLHSQCNAMLCKAGGRQVALCRIRTLGEHSQKNGVQLKKTRGSVLVPCYRCKLSED